MLSMLRPLLRNNRYWGSHPLPPKDWRSSKKCPLEVISALLQQLEEAHFIENTSDSPFTSFPSSPAISLVMELAFEQTQEGREVIK